MYKDSKKRHVQARSHRTGRCQVSARASIKSSALLQGRRGSSPVSVSLSRWSEAFPWNRGSSWTSFPARPRCRHLTRLSPKTQKQQVPLHHSKPQFKKSAKPFPEGCPPWPQYISHGCLRVGGGGVYSSDHLQTWQFEDDQKQNEKNLPLHWKSKKSKNK